VAPKKPVAFPDNIKVELRFEMMGVEARITEAFDLRDIKMGGPAPTPTKVDLEAWTNGQLGDSESWVFPVTPAERAAIAPVRQALQGTALLKDAKPFTPTPGPIDLNTARISFERDGKTYGVTFAQGAEMGPGYAEFFAAADKYLDGLEVPPPTKR
jgi:hypothetical protein